MNVDLEMDLANEDELRRLAQELQSAPSARVSPGFAAGVMAAVRVERRRQRFWRVAAALPVAAGLAICLAFSGVFSSTPGYSAEYLVACQRADGRFSDSSAASYIQAFAVTALAKDSKSPRTALDSAVAALVREQNADGGWANAELSARNVAALHTAAASGVAGAGRAYKRGLRYLHLNGIGEMSPAEFIRDARSALARVNHADRALACSAALCAN